MTAQQPRSNAPLLPRRLPSAAAPADAGAFPELSHAAFPPPGAPQNGGRWRNAVSPSTHLPLPQPHGEGNAQASRQISLLLARLSEIHPWAEEALLNVSAHTPSLHEEQSRYLGVGTACTGQ